jgi:tetratricopeptide (TPR) repeat protein
MYVDVLDEHVKLGKALLENKQITDAIKVLEVGRDLAERMKYHRLFLWLAQAYLVQAQASQAAQDRKKAEEWLANAASIVNHPPVPVPEEARATWAELKSRLTLGDKSSVFGFLRK